MGRSFEDLLEMLRGYRASRVLLTAVELDLFTALGEGTTASSVAAVVKCHPRSTETLLDALTALGALVKRRGSFFNTDATARYLASSSAECIRPGLLHTVNRWHTWSTLTESVHAGACVLDPAVEHDDPDWTRDFLASMDQNARGKAARIAGAVKLTGVRRMLDLGGGSGAYSIAFARASDRLTVEILDMPQAVPLAREYIRAAGLEDRIHVRAGDLTRDRLGAGFDLILLSAICHLFSAGENRKLFRRCHRGLAPGGRLLIRDFILDEDRAGPPAAALFALNMLVATRGGGTYTLNQYRDWLAAAGFRRVTRARGMDDLIIGRKSAD